MPREMSYEAGVAVRIEASTDFAVTCPDAAAAKWVGDHAEAWFGVRLADYWLPALKIRDAPALGFRGIHFCWFPELSAAFMERQIRMAAFWRPAVSEDGPDLGLRGVGTG